MTKFALALARVSRNLPGHHFQIALELENTELLQFRQLRAFGPISAFNEG